MVEPAPPPSGGGSVQVARYEPHHLAALADFYRDTWDPDATPARVASARADGARRNPVSPGSEVPTYLLLQDGRVLGHLSTIPVLVDALGERRPAYWFIGFMVRPEHRNGPIGYLLLKEASRALELTLSLTVATASVRLFKAVGFSEMGIAANFIRLLRPGRVLRRIDLDAVGLGRLPGPVRRVVGLAQLPGLAEAAGAVSLAGVEAWSALRSPWGGVAVEGVPPEGLDDLWTRVAPSLGNAAVRDGGYLDHRYPTGERGPYEAVRLMEGPLVRGAAYVRRPRDDGDPRLKGIRIATLSDWIFDLRRPADGLRLLAGAERAARAMGADALLVSASHRAARPMLARRAYLPFAGNLVYLIRDNRGTLPGTTTLADWWVSRGDMNADSVF